MSDEKKPDSLLVMPVSGKYCEIIFNNRSYKVWKVHPNTPTKFGTKLPYDIAVYFLGKVPPVITLVPEVKDGKYVSSILPEDQEKIKESLARGFTGGVKNYNDKAKTLAGSSDGGASSEALAKTLSALEAQIAKNTTLEAQLGKLTERLTKLEKDASATVGGAENT